MIKFYQHTYVLILIGCNLAQLRNLVHETDEYDVDEMW